MAKTLEEVERYKEIVREQTVRMNETVSKIKTVDTSHVKLADTPPSKDYFEKLERERQEREKRK